MPMLGRAWHKLSKSFLWKDGKDWPGPHTVDDKRDCRPENISWSFYIWVKDKNGKIICSNDILETKDGRVTVTIDQGEFFYTGQTPGEGTNGVFPNDISVLRNSVIIGNIFENPELLEKSKQ